MFPPADIVERSVSGLSVLTNTPWTNYFGCIGTAPSIAYFQYSSCFAIGQVVAIP